MNANNRKAPPTQSKDQVKIESTIGIPPGRRQENKWPLAELEIGQSFGIPRVGGDADALLKLRQVAATYKRRHRDTGWNYTLRSTPEDPKYAYRLWRLE